MENKIPWENLIKVMIDTNEAEPFENDLSLILSTTNEDIIIYQNLEGFEDLLEFLQKILPGFDNKTFINAMASTNNKLFSIWHKKF